MSDSTSAEKPKSLREAREARNLRQAAIAVELDVTQATISNWESGKGAPHPKIWGRVAAAYGVGVNDLLEWFGGAA